MQKHIILFTCAFVALAAAFAAPAGAEVDYVPVNEAAFKNTPKFHDAKLEEGEIAYIDAPRSGGADFTDADQIQNIEPAAGGPAPAFDTPNSGFGEKLF
jgi:hypothetical protein